MGICEKLASVQRQKKFFLKHPTDDTDVSILLIHYAPTASQGLFLQNCRRMTSKKHGSVLNILQVRKDLGEDVCRHILFADALLGCDTSGIFGLKKSNDTVESETVKSLENMQLCLVIVLVNV